MKLSRRNRGDTTLRMRKTSILTGVAIITAAPIATACQLGLPHPSELSIELPRTPVPSQPTLALPLQVPAYSSRPQASVKLFLDFDGDFTPVWGSFSPGITPAYSIDGDATTFTPAELESIRQAWSGVAEAFSPFNIDVTTIDPGPLSHFQSYRIVIGGTGSWYGPPAGGVAYAGGFFTQGLPLTAFVFSANLRPDDPLHASFVAAATAHESGHGFGLLHQSTWDGNTLLDEYNRGDAHKAPIMGSSYRKRGVWWLGPSSNSPYAIQDDLYILSNFENGFGYRADDHGNTPAGATPLVGSVTGVIEKTSDVDFFTYQSTGGATVFTLAPAEFGAMLDGTLALYDAGGTLLQLADTTSLGESIAAELMPGSYFLAVGSHGAFGDIGQYTLSVGLARVPEPSAIFLAGTGVVACTRRRRRSDGRQSA